MHYKVDTPLGFMSQPTSVCKTVMPFAHADRKLNFSSSSSPTKDVDKREVPSPLQCSSFTAGMKAGKMSGANKFVIIYLAEASKGKTFS